MYITNNQSLFYNIQPSYRVNAVNKLNGYGSGNSQQQQNAKTQSLEDRVNISNEAKLLFEAESSNNEVALVASLKEFVDNAQGNGSNVKKLRAQSNDLQGTHSQKGDVKASDERISSVNHVLLSKLRAYKQQDYALSSLKAS